MSTQFPNPTVTRAWAVYIDADDEFTLSTVNDGSLEWRVTADETPIAAGIVGHVLDARQNEGLNRANSGPGYIQLRTTETGRKGDSTTTVVITNWTA